MIAGVTPDQKGICRSGYALRAKTTYRLVFAQFFQKAVHANQQRGQQAVRHIPDSAGLDRA
jgi:hypothetical protein